MLYLIYLKDLFLKNIFRCLVPPQWTVEPKNATVVLGNTVWMDCAAVGFPAPSVTWKKLIYTGITDMTFLI